MSDDPEPGPDDLLIRKAQLGDASAMDRLMRAMLPIVRRWARAHIEGSDDADDVAQATLIAAAGGLSRFDGRSRIDTWIYRILRRCVADHYRGRRRWDRRAESIALHSEASDESVVAPPDPNLDAKAAATWIRSAFLALPNRQREVFDLIDLQGLRAEEVGARLGLSPATVRVHLLRARRSLRAEMMREQPQLVEDRGGLHDRS